MVLDFSESSKSFLPVTLLKSFILNCFSKYNPHFQSVLTCWDLIAENITKMSHIYTTRVLLKFKFSKLNISKSALFTQLKKCFESEQYLLVAQGAKSIILSSSYKIYCVKHPWFWFWLVFVPYATRAVFCSMDETLDIRLPLWFAISNSALKGKNLEKILTYKTLFNSKWTWSCVCPIHNITVWKLMEGSAT